MPEQVTIGPKKGFKPSSEAEKAAWAAVQKRGQIRVYAATARENIRYGNGMYEIVPDAVLPEVAAAAMPLEQRSMDELKTMLVSFGIKTEKTMRKADVIKLIRSRLDDIEIVDDEEITEGEGEA